MNLLRNVAQLSFLRLVIFLWDFSNVKLGGMRDLMLIFSTVGNEWNKFVR